MSDDAPRRPFRMSLGWFLATPAILWLSILAWVFRLNLHVQMGAFPIEDDPDE